MLDVRTAFDAKTAPDVKTLFEVKTAGMMTKAAGMVLAAALLCSPAHAATTRLMAGAGKSVIEITPAMLPIDGFGQIHDPLAARVVVVDNGVTRLAIVVVDQTSIFDQAVTEMRDSVAKIARTGADNVFVIASHTFSAPHMVSPDHLPPGMTMSVAQASASRAYRDAVTTAVAQAAADAVKGLREARIGFANGQSDVNVNRNVPSADGSWLGANDAGPSDKELAVLRLEAPDRRPIAVLMNYAVQSAIMDHSIGSDGTKGVTADLGGAAARQVEGQYDGAVALFLTGAAGDQAPGYTARRNVYDKDGHFRGEDLGDKAWTLVDLQGERLGQEAIRLTEGAAASSSSPVLRTLSGTVPLDRQERPRNLGDIRPSRSYLFKPAGTVEAPWFLMQIGDTAIVGVQAELSAITGKYIRDHSPFCHTMVVTMVNGAAKYMPDAASYKAITYQAMNAQFGPGAAETFASAIHEGLNRLKAGADH
ncbi:neutral/alkaline non-lysosomal ceramidase N-terminal domain-containing protein [Sphingomonas sp. OK281]|uniref:neutral/alkaline non-lysosomal ceramidase N-terminal domain-containing protein n=1 Tax=Sphingomonas sp. OK281 TaxID=1881067 RepID=UPI0008EC3B5C|nr:neutral/alkaline non-lysosomal ceramidase N-terminal domain-containing protein [Sphingomonas sp. OK281]SFO33525.1 Neutral/alkaline non-lysosomal ceramidase, N-terminal [Sphingomonas sp. OK281]